MRSMSGHWIEAIGRGLVVAVVIAALAAFRKWVSAPPVGHTGEKLDTEEFEDRFMPLRVRVIGGMIAIGILFAVGFWYLFSRTNSFLAGLDGPSDFVFQPQRAIWWFFPAFGALSLSWELTLQVWALFGDRKIVNLFSEWTNQSPSFWGAAMGWTLARFCVG